MDPSERKGSTRSGTILYSPTKHLTEYKVEMTEAVLATRATCLHSLSLGSLNYCIHFEEPDCSDRRKIEYCSGNERD